MKKKILVVTLHFDDIHLPVKRKNKLPQGMGAVFLAGAFSDQHCDIKVYSEQFSGPLENEKLLSWPDMVVLTGVTNCFDRMLHITAYARSKNPKVIVVAGGAPVRALPIYSGKFFDFCCTGDIEQLQEVIREALGVKYVAQNMNPRLDLAYWIGIHGHVETSRYCNFSCKFCSLTGEKTKYKKYDLNYIRKQFELMGKKRSVHFIDNNFYGNDRNFFLARLELIDEFRKKGQFKYWSALVSCDFFLNKENLELARKTGCIALFSGVESFDAKILKSYNKIHNTKIPQLEMITQTLEHGICFWYGLIMDVYSRTLEDLHEELKHIISNHRISLPGFMTIPIPLLGTPYFMECLYNNRFFPLTKLRHIDGTTLCMKPLSPLNEVVKFIQNLNNLAGYRRKILKHAFSFARHYRKLFNPEEMVYALASNAIITLNLLCTANTLAKKKERSFISTSEKLESTYKPAFKVERRYEHYFRPTMLTDEKGHISEDLFQDIENYKIHYDSHRN